MFCNMLDLFPSQIQWQFSCSALIQTQPNTAPASKIYIETWDTNNRHRSLELWHDAYIIAFIIQKLCLETPELSYRSHRSLTPKFVGNGTTYLCFGKWVSTKRTKHYNKLTLAPFLPVAKKKNSLQEFLHKKVFCFFSSSQGICGWDLKSTAENPTSEDATPSLSLQNHKFPVDRRRIWYHSIIEYNSFFCLTSDRKGCDTCRCGNGD